MSRSNFLQDFKALVVRGDVVDMAAGIIIDGVFEKIISSVVADIIMPPIGLLVDGTNFSGLGWELGPARAVNGAERAAVTANYGNFIQTMLGSVITAFAIFLFIHLLSNLRHKKKEAPLPPPAPGGGGKLLSEIRDLVKKQ